MLKRTQALRHQVPQSTSCGRDQSALRDSRVGAWAVERMYVSKTLSQRLAYVHAFNLPRIKLLAMLGNAWVTLVVAQHRCFVPNSST